MPVDMKVQLNLMSILQQHGITQANELVNLNDFYINHILSDLKSPNGEYDYIDAPCEEKSSF